MLEYSWANASANVLGHEHGLDIEKVFGENQQRIKEIISDIYAKKDRSGQWLKWLNLGYQDETVWYIKEYAAKVKGKFDNILVLGIGGSALGGIAVSEALLKPYWNMLTLEQRDNTPRIFFIDNIDPDQINGLLNTIDLTKTLVNVITKSGSTAETISTYMIIKDRLKKELGEDYRQNITVTTDREVGVLRQLAQQEGYKNFIVPDDVNGSYSVFSAVGLLPLALVGINIDDILMGVREMDKHCQNTDVFHNIAAQNALIHYLMDTEKNKNISVIMPYSDRLKSVAEWYIQLWAGALGKEEDLQWNKVNVGPTPIKAIGASDQHAQIQLFNEGPNDKLINFIRIKKFDTELKIPKTFEYTGIGYLADKSVNELINAEAEATRVSLIDNSRPNVTITLPKLDAYHLGQLLYMLEFQTAVTGALYNINTFVQNGVEQTKNYTYALMGRVGYEGSAEELREKIVR